MPTSVSIARAPIGARLLKIDWGAISPLRISSRRVAEGYYAGAHRAARRGAGVEFGGQRPYVPGDDLRFLDRRSLLKHDRLLVREFDTDTERALWLWVDASRSMSFRGPSVTGSKLAFAALLAATLARIAVSGHDPIGLSWLGARGLLSGAAPGFGWMQFERVVDALERADATTELESDPAELGLDAALVSRRTRRGSVIVLLSDFIDVPDDALRSITSVGGGGRMLVLVQVLDPIELSLGYRGKVRLRALEGTLEVTTDADLVRAEYLRRLEAHTSRWRDAAISHGGRLVQASSGEDAVLVVRRVLDAISGARA
ncbi:MAG: DUF58 domain-containing protein [Myxococcales bacterium]|nr:DUF58 domain-containing protein [Myxococcales bacterium]